jgi:hypothetical protein
MCAQIDLEVMCKRPKKNGIPFNFHEFGVKKIHSKKYPPKKKL